MVLSATSAATLTQNVINVQENRLLVDEIGGAESAIRNAARRQHYKVAYNATKIGNPPLDDLDQGLTVVQEEFYDAFKNAGYIVRRDEDSGYWLLRWAVSGAEELVRLYSVRTIVSPGTNESQTLTAIDAFFTTQIAPKATVRSLLVNPMGSGGNIDETQFGATASTFYEYVAIVQQGTDLDHAAALKSYLVNSAIGFATNNVAVYKIA